MLDRSRSLQIYLKPGIKEDELMIRVWDACRRLDRPQDVFRSMLRAGLMAMVESGEMPEAVIEECDLDLLLERRMRRRKRPQAEAQPQQAYAPFQYPAVPHAYAPEPARREHAAPPSRPETREAPPVPAEGVPEPAKAEPAVREEAGKPAGAEAKDSGSGTGGRGRIGNLM